MNSSNVVLLVISSLLFISVISGTTRSSTSRVMVTANTPSAMAFNLSTETSDKPKKMGILSQDLFNLALSENRDAFFGKYGSHRCVSFFKNVTSGFHAGC